MIIKKIFLKNIRSYKEQEIIFPEGSILLSGDIGAGKTSVLLAIEFALFGLQPGKRGSSLLRNGENEGKVWMEFEIDEKNIIVERSLKKGKNIFQDYCSITINGEREELSVTQLKNKILQLLNYPSEFAKKQNILYKFTVYTPQEEMKQIVLEDPETRLNTLRHVFGMDKYKRILENLSIIISKIREERRMREGLISNLEHDKLDLSLKEKELEEKYQFFSLSEKELSLKIEERKKISEERNKLSEKIEEKNNLQKEIEKTRIIILNKKDSISENNKMIKQLDEQINKLENLKFDNQILIQLNLDLDSLKNKKEKQTLEMLKINSELNSLNSKIDENLKLERKISNLEICPTCLQNVEAVHRANVLNKIHSDISEAKKRIKELEEISGDQKKEIEFLNKEISKTEEKIQELKILKIRLEGLTEKKKQIEEIKKNNSLLEKDIELLNQHVDVLQKTILEFEKYEELFILKEKELEEILEKEKEGYIRVAELKKEIEFSISLINTLKEKIKKTEEIKMTLDYLTELEDWFSKHFSYLISSIEKNVMIKLKSEFSKLFSEWFSMLVSDSFNISLKDDFTPLVEQQDYEIDYEYLSGGERTAVALAYRLSLNQVLNSLLSKIKTKDIVILDEPTDGFSEQQLDKMRDVLQQLNVKQLIIVSHEQKIEGFVENVIKFKKEANISEIENRKL